jgi:hypothetical protein
MLLKKDYAEGDIVSFKLVNGDEILARVLETNSDSWVISKPLTMVPSAKGIGLVQAMMGMDVDNAVDLQRSCVMMHALVVKDLADHYILTTTGIDPVTRGGIITGA